MKDDEIEISEITISFCEAVTSSSKVAFYAVLGFLFYPAYHIVNNIVLGHSENATFLAGLGLGSLTVGITGLSMGVYFSYGVQTFMAQEFGRNNLRGI